MKEDTTQYRIDRHLRGEMTEREEEQLLQDMKTDAALAEDVQLMEDISRSVSDWESKKRMMAQWEDELEEGNGGTNKKMKVVGGTWMKKGFPMLVALAACLVFGIFFVKPTPSKIEVNLPVVRGDVTAEQICRLVEAEEYKEALSLIDEVLADTLVDESLPKEEQDYLRQENELNRKTWEPVREQLIEIIR